MSDLNSRVIWITGLSGAGKSTLANAIVAKLRKNGKAVVMLDGDDLREIFDNVEPNSANHGREVRMKLAMRYALLCRLIAMQGFVVVIATISMFREVHSWNRLNLPGYFEAYLKVPVDELRRRDPKKIYERFDTGEISNVAGLDLHVDEPTAPDWVSDHARGCSIDELVQELMEQLELGMSA